MKMNKLDKQYTDLLQDILDNGVIKQDRTGTGTLSVFGRQIRHKMSDGFPLLTTKKMPFRLIATELLWFLRGDTNIKYLVDNNCHIWDGDAYKNYLSKVQNYADSLSVPDDISEFKGVMDSLNKQIKSSVLTQEEFIDKIKTDDEFAKKWGDLGPVYGKQWRSWEGLNYNTDQIANLIYRLKTNSDSRRLMVSSWNVGELDQMVLPPCHYGFQVYTRELTTKERLKIWISRCTDDDYKQQLEEAFNDWDNPNWAHGVFETDMDDAEIPTRAISLMWNQRSVDTFLGLPFNIASYGLLLEIIAKTVNMVPDELIGNLGDTHLYSNHIEQAKEQIGRFYTHDERTEMLKNTMGESEYKNAVSDIAAFSGGLSEYYDLYKIPRRTREPYPLPTLNINTEFWPYEGGECGIGQLDAVKVFKAFKDENFCRCLLEEDIQLGNYQTHPHIKAPLSN
jgi:thymidylate synthase